MTLMVDCVDHPYLACRLFYTELCNCS